MGWARLDDEAAESLKVRRAGTQAATLWYASITWCAKHRTDGVIERELVSDIWRPIGEAFDHESAAARLVEVGLWDEHPAGYAVHDFLDYNPSREEENARRARDADRQRRRRGDPPRTSSVSPSGVTADVQRDTERTSSVSHATPTRPDPTPSVRAPARVAPTGPIVTSAQLRSRLEHVIRQATGTGPFLDHHRGRTEAMVQRMSPEELSAEVEAFGAWLAGVEVSKRPSEPFLRFCDRLGSWSKVEPERVRPAIRVGPYFGGES
jgi:hypothetical protein